MQQNDEDKIDDAPANRPFCAIEFCALERNPIGRKLSAALEEQVVASLACPDPVTTSIVKRPGPTLTFDMLEEMLDEADREREKMFEKEVEAYLLAGCKVVVNEFIPDGKLVVLPKEYGDALERVLKRLRDRNEAQQFVYRNFYTNPLFNPSLLS